MEREPWSDLIGGRVDTFHTNSNLHHAYDPEADKWEMRSPLPTARSGHGCVVYRDRIYCMGGEGTNRVFAQNEAYDPKADLGLDALFRCVRTEHTGSIS